MITALRDVLASSIAESDYMGWVAWIGDQPIYEAVTGPTGDAPSLSPTAIVIPDRSPDRNTMDWTQLPFEMIDRVELYFQRKQRPEGQPVLRMDREPGVDLRWIQYKKSTVSTGFLGSLRRHGVYAYVMGAYNMTARETHLYEYRRDGNITQHPVVRGHPCWPKPWGLGLNPLVLGLTEADVPPAPEMPA